MKAITLLGIVAAAALLATPASAGYVVSATDTSKLDSDGVNFDYTITLKNDATSTSNVGTFWFAWLPGKDFMDVAPISTTSPAGWAAVVTHGASDGYAIRWVATGTSVTPGSSLTFGFKSAETPAQLAGFSPTNPSLLEGTSEVYSGAPFSDPGFVLVVTPSAAVPEPSSLMLSLLGGVAVAFRRRIGLFARP